MDVTTMPGYVAGFPLTLGLRELGGWSAADGRTVRHGLLYRGSALVDLPDEQRGLIDALGLRFVLDLRAKGEVEGRPDYVPQGAEYVRIGGMYDWDGNEVDFSPKGFARIAKQIEGAPERFMDDLYAGMMFGNPAVHALVERLVAGQAPLYFHCTAGKDRTGVCAAVLLMLLGVEDDLIVQEFLLTNGYRAQIINMPPDQIPADVPMADRENWAKINGVAEPQLRAALAAVDARHATREAYMEEEFGLDGARLAELRDRYLE